MTDTIQLSSQIVMAMMFLAMLLAMVRVLRGPSLPDRVVAIDLITTLAVGIIAVYSIKTGQGAFITAAIALALLAFLGTVALALYIRRGGPP
ncbi:MAG TPA: monovalent cation/H+ antiporter complex subunit F [Kiritimatiellia bacterium]|nr:monovalent cation/H+ antiporter complex subunit F [Kiritimatiellia bacterium]